MAADISRDGAEMIVDRNFPRSGSLKKIAASAEVSITMTR
jgi:hypothetical protein